MHNLRVSLCVPRVSLCVAACACLLLAACAGGSNGTGAAGNSGGGTTGSAGIGTAGTTGTAGNAQGGQTGTAGTQGTAGSGVAGNIAGSGGATGSAGTGGATGIAGAGGATGSAGTTGAGGTSGATGGATAGSAGTGGSSGSAGRGGSGGTGGRGGQGGTAGTAGTAGAGGTAAPYFTEGFESGTVGMGPAGWHNFLAYNVDAANPSGTTLALVDSARAHSGTKSLHVHGGSSPAQITRALPSGTNKLYVRAYIYLVRQLGGNTAVNGINHETLIGIRKTPGQAGDEVRFGETKGYIGTLDAMSDDWSPKLSMPTTAVVAPNRWTCFEVAFLADQTQHMVYAWVDGVLIHSITSTPAQWEHMSLSASWMTGKFGEAILGWQSFSNIDTDVWIDDIAFSTAPIGCN